MFKQIGQTFLNRRGFSVVEVMVGVAMLGGLSIAVVNMTKQQSKLSTKSEIDGDVSEVSARILNALNSPAYCRTNFIGKAVGNDVPMDNLQVIGKVIPKHDVSDAWVTNGADNITNRLRAMTISYSVADVPARTPLANSLATLMLKVKLQTKDINQDKKTIDKSYSATVIVRGDGFIVGCPISWNSTVPYTP